MQPQTSVMFCLVLTFVTHIQGLQFFIDTTSGRNYCGLLQCWADKFFTDTTIFSVYSLAVYDITQPSMPVQLAFLSAFDNKLITGDKTVVNVTGNMSSYHAELTLELLNQSYCDNASYTCELDFVNTNAQAQVIRETISPPGNNGSCRTINQIAKTAFEVKTHSDDLEKKNVNLGKNVVDLGNQVADLQQKNAAFKVELANLDEKVNSSCDITQSQCVKGMQHNASREHVCLWDKVQTLCDTETDGGGWIIIQRRTNGKVGFYRDWQNYKIGFGTPDSDFWIGNDNIHNLTLQGYTELRIDMEYYGAPHYAHYSYFNLTDETSNYRLSLSGYNGTEGDGMDIHSGMEFSTYDRSHTSDINCALEYHGAWWYFDKGCFNSNLNGLWGATDNNGLVWFRGDIHLTFSEMKIRQV